MSHARALPPAAGLAALLAAPAVARAQWDLRDERDGLEVAGYVGYGAFSNDGAFRRANTTGHGSLRGSVGLQGEVGYRVVPAFSAGVHGTFQFLAVDPSSIGASTDASAEAGALGFYGRFHPLGLLPSHRDGAPGSGILERADVYVGIGFDFIASAGESTRTATGFGTLTTNASTAGVAMPVVLGIEYLVHPNLYVGLMGEWSYWTAASVCGSFAVGTGGGTGCDSSAREPEGYLFVGAGVRGHFAFLR